VDEEFFDWVAPVPLSVHEYECTISHYVHARGVPCTCGDVPVTEREVVEHHGDWISWDVWLRAYDKARRVTLRTDQGGWYSFSNMERLMAAPRRDELPSCPSWGTTNKYNSEDGWAAPGARRPRLS
jgi:hypothetical protein